MATDAAGEGINLQICWLMVNYDFPWNPARLEQRDGPHSPLRQVHDPVVVVNLIAGSTREGRVLKTPTRKARDNSQTTPLRQGVRRYRPYIRRAYP